MTNATDVGIILVGMTIVFALASWFSVTVQRYWEQYGFKLFAVLLVLYCAVTAAVIVAANRLLRESDSMSPYWYILCAGVGVVYTSIGAAIVSKPMPMLPAALHPSFVRVALHAGHGITIEARGRKSQSAGAGFTTDDVRLYVEGDAFWTAMGTIVSSSLLSMAQMTILPVQLVPMYLPAGALKAGEWEFALTIAIGTKLNGQKGLGHNTVRQNLTKLVNAGDPELSLRFHTPPNQPLFTLTVKPSQLVAAIAPDAPPQLNLWTGPAPPPLAAPVGPQVDVKVPDVKIPDASAPAAPPATPSKQPLLGGDSSAMHTGDLAPIPLASASPLPAASAPGEAGRPSLSAPALSLSPPPVGSALSSGLPMMPAHAFVMPPPNFDAPGAAVGGSSAAPANADGNSTAAPEMVRIESVEAPHAPGAF